MKRRIRNTVTYLLFLSIGVFLFYLAALDITRGSLPLESVEQSFELSRGLGECGATERRMRIASVSPEAKGLTFSIVPEGSVTAVHSGILEGERELCLEEGEYRFFIPHLTAGVVVLDGVDKSALLAEDMRRASIPGILLSALLGYLAIVSRGARWLLMLEPLGYKVNRWRAIHSVAFAYFANIFVPRSGELARCVAIYQTDKVPVDRLFGTVISERVVDMLLLMGITALAFVTNIDAFDAMLSRRAPGEGDEQAFNPLLITLIGAVVVGGVALFVLRRSAFINRLYLRVSGFLKGVGEGLRSVVTMKRKGLFIFHTLFIWAMYFFSTLVIFKSIDATAHIPLHQALFIMVAGGFGMVIPAPGGIGSYHWMIKLAFIALGMSGTLGFAVANVMWLTQNIMIVIMGAAGYLMLSWFRIRGNRRTLAEDEAL